MEASAISERRRTQWIKGSLTGDRVITLRLGGHPPVMRTISNQEFGHHYARNALGFGLGRPPESCGSAFDPDLNMSKADETRSAFLPLY